MNVLIVVDMQNDFVTGTLGSEEAKKIVPNVKKKIEEYENDQDLIIFTRDTHFNNYFDTLEGKKLPVEHCINGTWGWNIIDELDVMNCSYVNKLSFGYTNWHFNESVVKRIELVGLDTDICVTSNALILRAMYPNMNIIVDASCCAGSTPEKHKAALEIMKSCQIDVIGE